MKVPLWSLTLRSTRALLSQLTTVQSKIPIISELLQLCLSHSPARANTRRTVVIDAARDRASQEGTQAPSVLISLRQLTMIARALFDRTRRRPRLIGLRLSSAVLNNIGVSGNSLGTLQATTCSRSPPNQFWQSARLNERTGSRFAFLYKDRFCQQPGATGKGIEPGASKAKTDHPPVEE